MLAACNGANNGGFPGPAHLWADGKLRRPPSSNQLEVLFPVPNSKNAPPGIANIYVLYKGSVAAEHQFDFLLSDRTVDRRSRDVHRHQQVAAPPGFKKPTYSNPVYYRFAHCGLVGIELSHRSGCGSQPLLE